MKKLLLFIFTFICLTANAKIAVKERSKIGIVSIDNPIVAENGGQGVFTITLSEASLTDTVIDFTVSGTASSNTDYTGIQSTTVVIPAGDTSRTITVFLIDDNTIDGTKTIVLNGTVTSGNAQNTTLSGTLTINDDDTGVVSVSTSTPFVAEPSATGLFVISMSNQSNTDTFITYTVTGTATSGVDFTAIPLTLEIPAGATVLTLPISVIDDLCVEAQETVIITLVSTSNTAIIVNSATSTIAINDNDSGAIVTVTATTPFASEQSGIGIFTFTIPCPLNTPTTINYTVSGTAVPGLDYVPVLLSIIIPANATSVTLPIFAVDDTIIENTEIVLITLISTSNPIVTVNTTPATVAILNNDSGVISVVATIPNASVNTNGLFTFTMSNPSSTDTTVTFTVTGTAVNGFNYTTIPLTIIILAGQTSVNIPVTTLNTGLCGSSKTVVITLTSTSNQNISPNNITSATVTIFGTNSNLSANVTFANNAATVTATGGVTPYSYSINGGVYQSSNIFQNVPFSNNVSFTVKDANGCTAIATNINPCDLSMLITGSLDNPVSAFTVSLSSISQTPLTGVFTYTLDGGASLPFNANFTATIMANTIASGSHVVIVTAPNGCTVTSTFNGGTAGLQISMIGTYNDYNNDGAVNLGDIVNLIFTVRNTGNTPINNVNVNNGFNQQLTVSGTTIPTLNSNAVNSTTFTGVQVLTQQNINQGFVSGAANASGTLNNSAVTSIDDYGLQLNISRGFKLNAFIDTNGNGVQDGAEVNFNDGHFVYQLLGNTPVNAYTTGTYFLYETNPTNSYNFSYNAPSGSNNCGAVYTVLTSSYSNVTLTGSGITTYNFAITQNLCADLGIYLFSSGGPRPGFINTNIVYYRNYGNTTIASGTITYTKDAVFTITSTSPATTSTATGFTYNFTNLLPYESRSIYVQMQVPTIPTVSIGQFTTNLATASIPTGDINTSNNTSSLTQDIRGAYDPNDKQESHGPKIVQSTFTANDYLTYKIQFENTGNENAITVKVDDVLDATLDPTTIKMIDASHSYVLKRVGNNLTWTFAGIDLPPSVPNTQIGHGYIIFQIKPVAGYVVGTNIPNTANIYFDFNPAIVTNTWNTEFVTTLSTNSFAFNDLKVYPNPANNVLNISNSEKIDNLAITNILGQTILNQTVNDSNATIDLSNVTTGIYFVKLRINDAAQSIKFIKK